MKGTELKIIFIKNLAYLSKAKSLTFKQIGIDDVARPFKSPAYWIIRVLNYRENERKIFAEILSYHVGETEFLDTQILLSNILDTIEIITFRGIDTSGLLRSISGTISSVFIPEKHTPVYRENTYHTYKNPVKKTINESFFIPIKDIHFKAGCVTFEKRFNDYKKVLTLEILNEELREEFDAVKNYFSKVLNSKKIQVTANLEIANEEIISIAVKSPEIESIDKQMIDSVKFDFVKDTLKKKTSIDKSLFTLDEYFEEFTNNTISSKAFYNDEKELFEDMLKITDTKHYKCLRLLSNKHLHGIMKLRFIHKPFSFIFLLQNENYYYLVWETLDTEEATYIWEIHKDLEKLKASIKKIENIITMTRLQGKNEYIKIKEENFKRIYHDYSDDINGFRKWKNELETILN